MRKPFNGDYRLSQGHGGNPEIYKRFGLKGHNGLDYALPNGTEVVAPHDGKILEATFDSSGYGNYLKIESDKEGSILAHLQSFKVKVGDQVKMGQVVAVSDNTGFSTGAHLHWGWYKVPRNRQDGYLGFIDQLPYLEPQPIGETPQQEIARLRKQLDDLDKQKRDWEGRAALYQKQYVESQAKYNGLKDKVASFIKVCKDEFGITVPA